MKTNKMILTVAALGASMSLAAVAQADDLSDDQLAFVSQTVQAQRSTAMQRYAGGRLQEIWNPQIEHNDVDWWLRSLGEWDSYADGAVSGKSRSVAAGVDMKTGKETRTGVYAMYNHTKLSSGESEGLQQDWRVGAYTGKQHGAVQQYGYVNYGKLGNHFYEDGSELKYHGQIVELGGEYKYDLHHADGKIYHVSPYVNVQASRYMQESARRTYTVATVAPVGPISLDLISASVNNNYLAGETGVELRRELPAGNYALRLGYKHVFAGERVELTQRLEMNVRNMSNMSHYNGNIDKDYLHLTVGGTLKLQPNLSLSAEGGWLKSSHDRGLMADVKLNWTF